MTPQNWELLQSIFHDASELPRYQRQLYLDDACGDDAVLRAEVEALLESASEDETLAEAIRGEAALVIRDRTGPRAGDAVGPYQLIKAIGQGGMGTVFLGIRNDREFERQVAIKFVTPEAATESLLARFRVERQILATLAHPNIAHLLDGGVTGGNVPYLVMEYVEGVSLEEHCRANALAVQEKIKLFLDICSAVEYAHSRMIIHRDIKPTNILVTREGKPKLLDFGVARIVTTDQTQTPQVTRLMERMMTLEYASPEQVRGEPVTAATDIYALGLLLYELLTGHHPFPIAGLDFLSAQRMICETNPSRPSAEYASKPRTPALSRFLYRDANDDLDAVVLMALRKKAAERYSSVSQFAEDLHRYLDGFPVAAQKGSRRYHAIKFIQRHRWGAATAAVFAVLIVGFGIGMGILAAHVTRERDAARLERSRSEQVTAFVESLFQSNDPYRTGASSRSLTAKDLLDAGAQRISTELAAQPEVRASLLDTLGEAYQHLGLQSEARKMFQQEIRTNEDATGRNSVAVAQGLRRLGDVERVQGDFQSAEQNLRLALAIQQRSLKSNDIELAQTTNNLGLILQNRGDLKGAEELFRRAVLISGKSPNQQIALVHKSNLASLLSERAQYADSEALFREVLQQRRRLMGENHPQTALSMLRLAVLLGREGRYAEAEDLDRQALFRYRKIYGDEYLDLLVLETNLAAILQLEGKLDESERLYRYAMGFGNRRYGKHVDAAIWNAGFAMLLAGKGQFTRAGEILDDSLVICRKSLAPGTVREARIREDIGVVSTWAGDFDRADENLQAALKIRQALAPDQPETAVTLFDLGTLRRVQGREAEARSLYERALAIDRKGFPQGHLQTSTHELAYARLLARSGDPSAAEVARHALRFRSGFLPPDAWQVAEAKSETGSVLADLGRLADAEPLLLDGYAGLLKGLGAPTLTTQRSIARLADFYARSNRPAQALEYRAKLLPFYTKAPAAR